VAELDMNLALYAQAIPASLWDALAQDAFAA
jgi:hypothetical protein